MNLLSDSFSRDEQLRIIALQLAVQVANGRTEMGVKRTADTFLDYIKTGNHR